MPESSRNYRWILIGATFVILPPILFFLGAAGWAALTYNGICPGIMDIAPYPCSIWEFIGRNTISPFALAAHLAICVTWVGFTVIAIFLVWLLRRGTKGNPPDG